jgi:membrane protein
LGAALLALGFGRRRVEPGRVKQYDLPPRVRPAHQKVRRAWFEIVRLLYSAIGEHRVVSIAAGVTFFSLLAIFPAIAALVSIYGIFADPANIQAQLSSLSSILPGGAIDVISDQLQRVASGGRTRLGATFTLTLAISLWSANAGMKALFDALNIVYGATESRGLVKLNAISLAFTGGALLVAGLAVGAIIVLPVVLQYVGLEGFIDWIVKIGRWPVLYVLVAVGFAVIYRFGPDRQHAQWHWITWGSAIAALIWIVVSILFSWYAANFGSYNKTYGSLGAVVGFMTWIWISCMTILGGAEIDAAMERLDRDSAK